MRSSQSIEEFINQTTANVKPNIQVGNYFLKWAEASIGIPTNEENSLRQFVRDLARHVSSTIFAACGEFYGGIDRHAKDRQEVKFVKEAFDPQILLSRNGRHVGFSAAMNASGKAVIFMREQLLLNHDSLVKKNQTPKPLSLVIEWELGELVFDRQARTARMPSSTP